MSSRGSYSVEISDLPAGMTADMLVEMISRRACRPIRTSISGGSGLPTRLSITHLDANTASYYMSIIGEIQPTIFANTSYQLDVPPLSDEPNLESEEFPYRRSLLVEEAGQLIQSGRIIQSIVDPENQQEVPSGLTRVTLIGIDGQEYDVLTRYDSRTNQIFPPQ